MFRGGLLHLRSLNLAFYALSRVRRFVSSGQLEVLVPGRGVMQEHGSCFGFGELYHARHMCVVSCHALYTPSASRESGWIECAA